VRNSEGLLSAQKMYTPPFHSSRGDFSLFNLVIRITAFVSVLFLSWVVCGAAEIDRKTFSLSLPSGWTEDIKDDMYDPDSVVFFENSESCLCTVIIGKKSAGATVEKLFKAQKEAWLKKFTDSRTIDFSRWSGYDGKGVEIEGKIQGITRSRARVFGFEKNDNVCIISEFGTIDDLKTFASDFEQIQKTFKLK